MPKTLPIDDPNLLKAVERMRRSHNIWAVVLIVLGLLTQYTAVPNHLVAGLPFIVLGVACWRWKEPALLVGVAAVLALSALGTALPQLGILGPDPFPVVADLSLPEMAALVLARLLLAYVALNQFVVARLLYGTERATTDDPNLPHIPGMVPNRTDTVAKWARRLALVGAGSVIAALVLVVVNLADITRALAEVGGSLGALATGLGLGAAFAPTDERPAALSGVGVGLIAYLAGVIFVLTL
jgi:hypothetical protein